MSARLPASCFQNFERETANQVLLAYSEVAFTNIKFVEVKGGFFK